MKDLNLGSVHCFSCHANVIHRTIRLWEDDWFLMGSYKYLKISYFNRFYWIDDRSVVVDIFGRLPSRSQAGKKWIEFVVPVESPRSSLFVDMHFHYVFRRLEDFKVFKYLHRINTYIWNVNVNESVLYFRRNKIICLGWRAVHGKGKKRNREELEQGRFSFFQLETVHTHLNMLNKYSHLGSIELFFILFLNTENFIDILFYLDSLFERRQRNMVFV